MVKTFLPLHQQFIHPNITEVQTGDCVRACVASLLCVPIKQVPHFVNRRHYKEDWNRDWYTDLQNWLNRVYHKDLEFDYSPPLGRYSIGNLRVRENEYHAVICWGFSIVHDPNPRKPSINARNNFIYWMWF